MTLYDLRRSYSPMVILVASVLKCTSTLVIESKPKRTTTTITTYHLHCLDPALNLDFGKWDDSDWPNRIMVE